MDTSCGDDAGLQHGAPEPMLAVCSALTSFWLGAYRDFARNAARSVSTSYWPSGPGRGLIWKPPSAACTPPSLVRMCAVGCARISSPGRQWVRIAVTLHIV